MIPAVPTNFPSVQEDYVNHQGEISQVWRQFLLNIFNRTGGGSGVNITTAAVSAAGTTQADATALMSDVTFVTTVAAGSGVSLFPPSSTQLQPGQSQAVFNRGANALSVYPPSGCSIDALALNAAYSLAVGKMQIFWFQSQQQYLSTQLG